MAVTCGVLVQAGEEVDGRRDRAEQTRSQPATLQGRDPSLRQGQQVGGGVPAGLHLGQAELGEHRRVAEHQCPDLRTTQRREIQGDDVRTPFGHVDVAVGRVGRRVHHKPAVGLRVQQIGDRPDIRHRADVLVRRGDRDDGRGRADELTELPRRQGTRGQLGLRPAQGRTVEVGGQLPGGVAHRIVDPGQHDLAPHPQLRRDRRRQRVEQNGTAGAQHHALRRTADQVGDGLAGSVDVGVPAGAVACTRVRLQRRGAESPRHR